MKLEALHVSHGYSLYQEDRMPYVVREWTRYRKNEAGERVAVRDTMRLELLPDQFAGGKQSMEVYRELLEAWVLWIEWQRANGKA